MQLSMITDTGYVRERSTSHLYQRLPIKDAPIFDQLSHDYRLLSCDMLLKCQGSTVELGVQGIENIFVYKEHLTGIQLWAPVSCVSLLASELDQSEDSVGKPRNRAVSWSSDIDLSPNALDSPVVVSKGIGAEPNEQHIYHPDHGRQPPNSRPNPTKPGVGVGGIVSAATAFKITAEAIEKCANDVTETEWFFTSVGKDRDQRGPQNTHENT
eukprot:scaffold15896_cov60-Cyclotella_meneghiniana.AAC.1